MFSGVVERIGTVQRAARAAGTIRFTIGADFAADLKPGESVATNGVCLTVERATDEGFEVVAVGETLARTTLGALEPGGRVNLERALRVGDLLGGHWVMGHVDGVAIVRGVEPEAGGVRLSVDLPDALSRYVATKGSIAIDGVSLTVAAWRPPVAEIALVPHTLARTIAGSYAPGTRVNLEVDLVARYLERLLEARTPGLAPAAVADRRAPTAGSATGRPSGGEA